MENQRALMKTFPSEKNSTKLMIAHATRKMEEVILAAQLYRCGMAKLTTADISGSISTSATRFSNVDVFGKR